MAAGMATENTPGRVFSEPYHISGGPLSTWIMARLKGGKLTVDETKMGLSPDRRVVDWGKRLVENGSSGCTPLGD